MRNGKQKYKCLVCGSYFSAKKKKNPVWIQQAYKDYTVHKQTYQELSDKYGRSHKTLRKYFDAHSAITGELKPISKPVVLILDATFFGRGYGILLASIFFFNDTATTEIYTLSLHDALPIYGIVGKVTKVTCWHYATPIDNDP